MALIERMSLIFEKKIKGGTHMRNCYNSKRGSEEKCSMKFVG